MKQLYYFCLLLVMSLMVSCGDDDPTPLASKIDTYMPLTTGSEWSYKGSLAYTAKITGNKKTINSKEYYEASATKAGGVPTLSYYRIENDEIQSYSELPGLTDPVEMIIMKEKPALNGTWSSNVVVQSFTYKYTFTVEKMLTDYTVHEKTYKDVAQVKMVVSIDLFGTTSNIIEANYFYAKNIGLVHADLGIVESYLDSYTIK
jgi:hypothetical protein